MSVDNNGKLFLGKKENEIDLSRLEGFEIDEDEGLAETLDIWNIKNKIKPALVAQEDNGYNMNFYLIGFELADSGSYGCKRVENLPQKIEETSKQFRELFGIEPDIYILNYQW